MMSSPPTYMGTKRELAPKIAAEIAQARKGPMLDLFAGMASVGRAVGTKRHLWLNDAQLYACTVNRAVFQNCCNDRFSAKVIKAAARRFEENLVHLNPLIGLALKEEEAALKAAELERLQVLSANQLSFCLDDGKVERERARAGTPSPYRLFASTYAGGYFGLRQCAELDSIRYAIDALVSCGEVSSPLADQMLAGLCRAASVCSNSTGHFAQYLSVKPHNIRRFVRQRQRSIWVSWIEAVRQMTKLGSAKWRRANRIFNQDANELLGAILSEDDQPSVIYADPPYTSDQYSRYYHVLETLLLYDYPEPSGKGQYRPERFASSFCSKRSVEASFERLIEQAARMRATLVISYPTNGLLDEIGGSLSKMLSAHFANVNDPIVIEHHHSTMGASKGTERMDVEERVFVAR